MHQLAEHLKHFIYMYPDVRVLFCMDVHVTAGWLKHVQVCIHACTHTYSKGQNKVTFCSRCMKRKKHRDENETIKTEARNETEFVIKNGRQKTKTCVCV